MPVIAHTHEKSLYVQKPEIVMHAFLFFIFCLQPPIKARRQMLNSNLAQHLLAAGSTGGAVSEAASGGDVGVFGMGAAGSAADMKGSQGKGGYWLQGKGSKGPTWVVDHGKGKGKDSKEKREPKAKKGLLSLSMKHNMCTCILLQCLECYMALVLQTHAHAEG